METHDRRHFTDANRAAWDEAAAVHRRLDHEALRQGFSQPGFSTLSAHNVALLEGIGLAGRIQFMEEIHPVLYMCEEGRNGAPSTLAHSYFRSEPWRDSHGFDYFEHRSYDSKPMFSFQHTLAAILNTALNTGLSLRRFDELSYDISGFCTDLEQADATPPLGMTIPWQRTV